ncbi:MAG: type II secretion system protein GspG, partial [Pseudomonadota bacterium]
MRQSKSVKKNIYRSPRLIKRNKHGFSLIEMLVVVVILGLIASIVAPNLIGKIAGAKSKTATVQIEDLAAAVELYYLDIGIYPTTEQGLQALIESP